MNQNDIKRVFFGFEVLAPWPSKLPVGRLLDENHRHMTIAFIGETHLHTLTELLETLPKPEHKVGIGGFFDSCLFLPPKHFHTASWHIQFDPNDWKKLTHFHETFCEALFKHELLKKREERPLLPHVTLARTPLDPKQWKKHFTPIPLILKDFHLFESIGNLQYPSLWKVPIYDAFQEISHTADIAFRVHGENLDQLFKNAAIALSFRFPPFFRYFRENTVLDNLDDLIISLNEMVALADEELNCPFKAVSFHGSVQEDPEGILTWEMIVDV